MARALVTGPFDVLDGSTPPKSRRGGPDVMVSLSERAGPVRGQCSIPSSWAVRRRPSLPDNVVTTYGMTETGSGLVYDGVLSRGGSGICPPAKSWSAPMLMRPTGRDGPFDADGWFATVTGPLGPGGKLEISGRLSEMIITAARTSGGGRGAYPAPAPASATWPSPAARPRVGERVWHGGGGPRRRTPGRPAGWSGNNWPLRRPRNWSSSPRCRGPRSQAQAREL